MMAIIHGRVSTHMAIKASPDEKPGEKKAKRSKLSYLTTGNKSYEHFGWIYGCTQVKAINKMGYIYSYVG